MQGRYEEYCIVVRQTAVQLSTQLPVRVVYEHKNSRSDAVALEKHVRSPAQHVVADPDQQLPDCPASVRRRQSHMMLLDATKQQFCSAAELQIQVASHVRRFLHRECVELELEITRLCDRWSSCKYPPSDFTNWNIQKHYVTANLANYPASGNDVYNIIQRLA